MSEEILPISDKVLDKMQVNSEYVDSDAEEDLTYLSEDDPQFYAKVIQKAFSIFSMRKLNYVFKCERRKVF